jgi:hypothetical protein
MKNKHFDLGTTENSVFVNVLKIIFGILCIIVAIFWIIYTSGTTNMSGKIWISILFILGFGLYLLLSGFGKTNRYLITGPDYICIKKNSLLPEKTLKVIDIEKVEIYSLNIVFILKNKIRFVLRFGTVYYETSEKIKDEIISFAETHKIATAFVNENI